MDILSRKKIISHRRGTQFNREEKFMKNTDDLLRDINDFSVEKEVHESIYSAKMIFKNNLDSTVMPSIQKSKKAASNRTTDVDSGARWEDSVDDSLIDDEIITEQMGYGYSPQEKGFVSRDVYDYLDRDPNDEIVGKRLKD
jgi:hypothetical protein